MNSAIIRQYIWFVRVLCIDVVSVLFVKKLLVTNTGVIMLHETEEDGCCGGGCQSCKEGCECGK